MMNQYSKHIRLPFDQVMDKLEEALHQQGFSMINCIDVKEKMGTELGVNFRNYSILNACIPEVSYKAISLEPHIGILLPCNIVVQEHENGTVEISGVNPLEDMDRNMVTSSLESLAAEVSNKLRAALDTVSVKPKVLSFSYN